MTSGVPRPPLRMMAPRGAPIKKNMMHANESVNFFLQLYGVAAYGLELVGLLQRPELILLSGPLRLAESLI